MSQASTEGADSSAAHVLDRQPLTRWQLAAYGSPALPLVLLGTPLYVVAAWFLFFPPLDFSQLIWAGMTFDSGCVWVSA